MSVVLVLIMSATMLLFFIAAKARAEYLETIIYHSVKTEEINNSNRVIKAQKVELLELQQRIYAIKKEGLVCPRTQEPCIRCDSSCPFRKEGDK